MTPLEMLSRRVATQAPTAPDFLIATQLRQSAVSFLKRTRAWRQELVVPITDPDDAIPTEILPGDVIPIIFGEYYAEPAVASAVVHEIEAAWWNDRHCRLHVRPFADYSPNERLQDGPPNTIYYMGGNNVLLAPRSAGTLYLSVFLRPSEDLGLVSTHFIPHHLAERFGQEIVYGALASLLAMPEKPWSQPDLAMLYAQRDEREKDRNFDAHTKGITRTPTRARTRMI